MYTRRIAESGCAAPSRLAKLARCRLQGPVHGESSGEEAFGAQHRKTSVFYVPKCACLRQSPPFAALGRSVDVLASKGLNSTALDSS